MKKEVIIFGGAFNPPTKGHESVIRELAKKGSEVWVMPSFAHAHGKKPISFKRRLELTEILLSKIGFENVKVSGLEEDCFNSVGKNYVYTYDLLVFLSKKYPEYNFKFACGSDNAKKENWSKFYKSKEIDKEFGKIVVEDTVLARSTLIRNALHEKDKETALFYTYKEIIDLVIDDY